VEGVLPVPALTLPGIGEPESVGIEHRPPGAEFLAALLAEKRARTLDDRVTARRTMKRLCPELLRRYLDRRIG
jgi:hypothetical protein